jgi:LPXTG-motif cell wall-anchored protein
MHDERMRRRLTRSAALLGALALVGFGPTTTSYAAKPTSPPGQGQQAAEHRTSGTAGTSGEATSPQPRSRADRNGAGANQPGAYDSTRDGSPSRNGNGGGEATGKPCAGCVGKADNKNPPGQAPNGSDHNAGYECDRNAGIGRTNPAHTGCTTTTPPTTPEEPRGPEVPPGVEEPQSPEQPEGPCEDLPATPEDDCGEVLTPESEVPGDATPASTTGATSAAVHAAPAPSAQVLDGADTERASAAVLPATGAASGALLTALAGLLLLGAGVALTRWKPVRVRA